MRVGYTYYSKDMRLRFQAFRWSDYHRIDFLPYIVYRRGAYPNDDHRQLAFGWLIFEMTIVLKK